MKKSMLSDKRGSALLASVIIALVVGLWVASAIQSSLTEYKLSLRYLDMQKALNLAESGLEEGIRAYKASNWTGWNSHSNGYYKEESVVAQDWGLEGTIKIFITKGSSSPQLAAEGTVTSTNGTTVSKQILVKFKRSSLFSNGLLSRRQIIMNGTGVTVDSYDSRLGDYTPAPSEANRFANGNVGSMMLHNEDPLLNQANIYGYISVAGEFDFEKSFHKKGILGPLGSPERFQDPDRVTEDFYADLPPVEVPSYGSWDDVRDLNGGASDINGPLTLGDPSDTTPAEYQAERISLSGAGDVLTINGPVTLFVRRNVSVSGNGAIRVTENGSLTLYSQESLSITGNGSLDGMQNETKKPEKFMIYNTTPTEGGTSVDVAGNGKVYAVVYAPNSNIHLQGGGSSGTVHGSMVGWEITLSGGYAFHYDEALADLGGGGTMAIEHWRELKTDAERLPFDNVTNLNAYF
ncbi:hypothetical protein [Pelagicoccus sp. SDUM812003]|uniref:pilus assembly PilX family protein n=1 Tax=Pelagicoccus sp. SDUM812003 TaxID=3041267 RepID=UPI00280E5894|nr:hypothetical protein [Pelagicoccus sp. SDUM812003]MDQ8201654.1 hypothetical protein [Pelagicoccus sp. SDUM812003]